MNLFQILSEMIDMRSFSNLWYWIILAIAWSSASHWILGVPFDLVGRARRKGGKSAQDFETLVQINVSRRLYVMRTAGAWIVALVSFLLSGLLVLGFWFSIEFAQAVLLIAAPMTVVSLFGLRFAARIERENLQGEALIKAFHNLRMITQAIGVVSIFVTSMWGMWQNLQLGAI